MLFSPLDMALVNHSSHAVEFAWGKQVIAKISFFDVSDTYPIVPRTDWLKT